MLLLSLDPASFGVVCSLHAFYSRRASGQDAVDSMGMFHHASTARETPPSSSSGRYQIPAAAGCGESTIVWFGKKAFHPNGFEWVALHRHW